MEAVKEMPTPVVDPLAERAALRLVQAYLQRLGTTAATAATLAQTIVATELNTTSQAKGSLRERCLERVQSEVRHWLEQITKSPGAADSASPQAQLLWHLRPHLKTQPALLLQNPTTREFTAGIAPALALASEPVVPMAQPGTMELQRLGKALPVWRWLRSSAYGARAWWRRRALNVPRQGA